MPTTPKSVLRYPSLSDAANGPQALQNLATDLDQLTLKACTSATRPASPWTGQVIYETDTEKLMVYDGAWLVLSDGDNMEDLLPAVTAWTAYTPSWTSSGTAPALNNGTLTGAWRVVGKTIDAWMKLVAGTTTTYGTGSYSLSRPTAGDSEVWDALGTATLVDTSASLRYGYNAIFNGSSGFSAVGSAAERWGVSVPFTMASTDTVSMRVQYTRA